MNDARIDSTRACVSVCIATEPQRRRKKPYAREFFGRLIDVLEKAWGGQWADSTRIVTGMVTKYHGHARLFTITFPPEYEANPEEVSWEQLLGETPWNGVILQRQPLPHLASRPPFPV